MEAVKKNSLNVESIKPFAGMDFYRVDNYFICREDLQRYSYEEILKINSDLPDLPDAAGMIEFKGVEQGKIIVNRIVILPISKDEMLEYTFKNLL